MHGELPKQIWAKTSGRNRRILAIGLIVILTVVALVYIFAGSSTPQRRPGRFAAEGPVPVLVAAAVRADVPVYLGAVGTTRALNTVTVRAQVDGKLLEVAFKEGQDVKKGDVVARIDPTTFQAQLNQAAAKKAQDEAQLANAKRDLERYERLAATNAINRQQLDTQKALVNQNAALVLADQAAVESAQATLGYTNIVAPIDGRTGIRQVDEGNIVHPSDSTGIVTLTQLHPISVLFNLPQQELNQVNSAFAKGPLSVDAQRSDNDAVIDRGTLRVVDNQVDQSTGTVKLKAEFPNAELQLWPGQFVNVRLLIDTLKQVTVIPTGAVQRGPNGTFVYVVKDDNTVTMRPINVQKQDETQTVVASGVEPSERVVTTGFARLVDGGKIAIGSAEGAPAAATQGGRQRSGQRPAGDDQRQTGAKRSGEPRQRGGNNARPNAQQ
jgi:multidrug efflux system membrane fusion protein